MNTTNYKQYDTRWSGLGYPKKPWYIKNCGCGEVAICNSIIEMANMQAQTPKTIQPYCKQYADPKGNGTYHSGIPAMMKHYGLTEVKEHATMPALFKELAKGNRVAILLMGSRLAGTKKIKWTSSGHFIAATGFKIEKSKNWLYIKDSNSSSASRNGWLSYEESLKNACYKVWSGKLSGSVATTPTTTAPKNDGKLVVDGIGGVATVRRLQQFLGVTQTDGITIRKDLQKYVPALKAYDYGNGSPTVKAMQKWLGLSGPDGLWGSNTSKALQLKVGFPKSECDGIFGPNSMKKLQQYLNEHDKAVYPTPAPTPAPAQTLIDKEIEACKVQAEWMKNYTYKWVQGPTIANSKTKGTCVTYVAVVLQRIGILKSKQFIWINNKGKVEGANSKMTVTYPSGTLKSNKSKLKRGDIVIGGNGKTGAGDGSHIFILTGKWDGDNPYIYDQDSAGRVKKGKAPEHTWKGSFRMIALIRLK